MYQIQLATRVNITPPDADQGFVQHFMGMLVDTSTEPDTVIGKIHCARVLAERAWRLGEDIHEACDADSQELHEAALCFLDDEDGAVFEYYKSEAQAADLLVLLELDVPRNLKHLAAHVLEETIGSCESLTVVNVAEEEIEDWQRFGFELAPEDAQGKLSETWMWRNAQTQPPELRERDDDNGNPEVYLVTAERAQEERENEAEVTMQQHRDASERVPREPIINPDGTEWFWCLHCERLFKATLAAYGEVTIGKHGEETHHLPATPLLCPDVARGSCDGGSLDVWRVNSAQGNLPRPHWPPPDQWEEGDKFSLYD